MKVDEIFLLYENSGKYFKTYNDAWRNSRKPLQEKQVYYVFTPTMYRYKRVGEIERASQNYFRKTSDCDFYNIFTGESSKQLRLFGEC